MNEAASSPRPAAARRAVVMLRRVAVLLAVLLFLAIAFVVWAHRQSYRVIGHWAQSSAVEYSANGPYNFMVVESDRDWRGFPFSFGRHYFLLIGHEISGDQTGYQVDYSFHPGAENIEAYIRNCAVEWTPLGVWFQEPSGQRLFIPKEAFAAGE